MISLLLHESEVKPRMSVNNKDIILILGYNYNIILLLGSYIAINS